MRKLSIIIPVFNEAKTVSNVIAKVKQVSLEEMGREIIVVDDGSKDGTNEVLKGVSGITFVSHAKNMGKGAAIKTGIAQSTGDLLLLQDADLEYHPEDYPALLKPLLNGEADLVIGSRFRYQGPRFFTKGGDPFVTHYIGNRMIIWLTNLLYQQSISDYEGCYKVFQRSVVESISVATNRFAFDNELICKAIRKGFRLAEVPIRYSPRLYTQGKKIRWTDGVAILWTILKWRVLPM